MRRLSGLLYLDAKIVGDIKEKLKKSMTYLVNDKCIKNVNIRLV